MSKYTMTDIIKTIEHKFVKKWVKGVGSETKFKDETIGYYAVFTSCPASIFLGNDEPKLKAGDRVRITLEKMP